MSGGTWAGREDGTEQSSTDLATLLYAQQLARLAETRRPGGEQQRPSHSSSSAPSSPLSSAPPSSSPQLVSLASTSSSRVLPSAASHSSHPFPQILPQHRSSALQSEPSSSITSASPQRVPGRERSSYSDMSSMLSPDRGKGRWRDEQRALATRILECFFQEFTQQVVSTSRTSLPGGGGAVSNGMPLSPYPTSACLTQSFPSQAVPLPRHINTLAPHVPLPVFPIPSSAKQTVSRPKKKPKDAIWRGTLSWPNVLPSLLPMVAYPAEGTLNDLPKFAKEKWPSHMVISAAVSIQDASTLYRRAKGAIFVLEMISDSSNNSLYSQVHSMLLNQLAQHSLAATVEMGHGRTLRLYPNGDDALIGLLLPAQVLCKQDEEDTEECEQQAEQRTQHPPSTLPQTSASSPIRPAATSSSAVQPLPPASPLQPKVSSSVPLPAPSQAPTPWPSILPTSSPPSLPSLSTLLPGSFPPTQVPPSSQHTSSVTTTAATSPLLRPPPSISAPSSPQSPSARFPTLPSPSSVFPRLVGRHLQSTSSSSPSAVAPSSQRDEEEVICSSQSASSSSLFSISGQRGAFSAFKPPSISKRPI
ncbi:hypothetical protein QOT17_017551 [Balamuthia mandrillaris]